PDGYPLSHLKQRLVLACSEPERLPPRVQSLGRPRWDPETVRRWVLAPAETRKRRVGRPRGN
ncbi:hypothetical protein GC248_00295, partial [Acetobacter senegalensis]|nr:hypothetical protein [Acetobacter senegalensis]